MAAHALSRRSHVLALLLGALVLSTLMLAIDEPSAEATPVASNPTAYAACGRVFPDPHAYWPSPESAPGESPWAKGNAICRANEFITYQEMIDGSTFLETLFPEFVEFYNLEQDFGDGDDCATSTDPEDMCSAGLPGTGGVRKRENLFMIRVSDERVPDDDKRFFVFPLSIHGIERAGAEAGTRAAEDLATWAYCEAVANGETVAVPAATVNCAQEGSIPHPLLETQPQDSITAGAALKQSAIYFVFANPDGWRRGDPDNVFRFYQRYNGNGVDLNRDWPTIGYTFRPYTPWSEPESKHFGEVLQGIRDQWDGGIDLHGQLIDRAFSFTLLGASQRDFGKNQRILQTVKGAWADAEQRLSWSPLIKPNDAPPQPDDPRMYGVQWGTVWDTIDYTVTGSLGDWIDSPLGLGADGIDNEMSLSHLSNCGTGSCYQRDAEQLHVDGNKSLVYAMVNFSLLPEDQTFGATGRVGYILDDTRLRDRGDPTPTAPPDLPTQEPIIDASLDPTNNYTYAFEIQGPESDPPVYNGGVTGTATPLFNAGGIGGSSLMSLVLEQYRGPEENPPPTEDTGCADPEDNWQEVNRYFNQSSIYLQSGQAVHGNQPTPGVWRICVTGGLLTRIAGSGGAFDLDITFQGEQAWEDPGQLPYDVSNMDFFTDLRPYMQPKQLQRFTADQVLAGTVNLTRFDSLVIADDPFPGYTEPIPTGPAQEGQTHNDPGVGTAPCAYQRGTTDVPPGSNNPPAGCANSFEFDVDPAFNNQQMTVELSTENAELNDWDLFVDRQGDGGGWSEVGRSAGPTGNEKVTVFTPPPGHYRALVVNWSAGDPTSAKTLEIAFSNEYAGPPVPPSTRTEAEKDQWGELLRSYVAQGGNLVLTDGAIKDLAYMDLFPREEIATFSVYAGFIGFTRDGGDTSTYDDPLAENVNQPGAAEGPGHRHQTYEPVPIGYAIQDESGSDFNSSPAWAVDQGAWEGAGGRTVGTTTADKVTFGELPVGAGQVRIIGTLLPMPSEQYYHPFGLSSYALTYTGYQVLSNALLLEPAVLHTLTVSTEGDGKGVVTSKPAGIDCRTSRRRPDGPPAGDCSADFEEGTEVTLTAHPKKATSEFAGWSGDCTGTETKCTLVMDGDKSVTATFVMKT